MLCAPPAPSPSARERLRTAPGPGPCKHLAASGNAAALPRRAIREGRADVRSSAPPGRCSGLAGRRNSAAARPDRQRDGRRRPSLLGHESDSQACLHAAADRAASKHNGGSCNRGKAGPTSNPARGPDDRRRRGARVWRGAGRFDALATRPAFAVTPARTVNGGTKREPFRYKSTPPPSSSGTWIGPVGCGGWPLATLRRRPSGCRSGLSGRVCVGGV